MLNHLSSPASQESRIENRPPAPRLGVRATLWKPYSFLNVKRMIS